LNKTADIAAADIEASPEYQALLVAVAGKPERSMGDAVIPAEPPAWGEARKLANSLLSDPPHLSVLVFLTKAEANVAGYIGMYQAFERMHDNLLSAWDSMIPEADADDPDDPYYERVNYLHELSEDPAFISGLQRIPLVEVRGLGAFSVRDIDIANGQIEGTEEEVARCQEGLIRGAFAEAETETLTETQNAVTGLIALIDKIETLFNERAGAAHGLSLSQLQACLAVCQSRLNDFVVVNTSQTTENDDSMPADTPSKTPGTQHAATAVTTVRPGAALADRDAVCASFDQIIRFYQQYEPTSPVPVLAQRARDMTSKSFFEVLEDLGAGEKGNLPALLGALDGNPLGSVLNDSYQRFLNGEVIAPVTAAEITTESVIVTPAEPEQVEPAGEPDLSDVAQAGNNEHHQKHHHSRLLQRSLQRLKNRKVVTCNRNPSKRKRHRAFIPEQT